MRVSMPTMTSTVPAGAHRSAAMSYVHSVLADGEAIARMVEQAIRQSDWAVVLIYPGWFGEAETARLETGHLPPDPGPGESADTQPLELGQRIQRFVSQPDGVCVMVHDWVRPCDPWLAAAQSRICLCGDEVLSLILDGHDDVGAALAETTAIAELRILGFMDDAARSRITAAGRLTQADAEAFIQTAREISVTAYDGQGYVCLARL